MFDPKIANEFSTYTAYNSTQTAAKVLGTSTAYKYMITDLVYNAATLATMTFLLNTTTTLFTATPNITGATMHFHFNTPIAIPTNSALHVTTASTVTSLFVSGWYRA